MIQIPYLLDSCLKIRYLVSENKYWTLRNNITQFREHLLLC